jgi:parallel beta-helix repeat protein
VCLLGGLLALAVGAGIAQAKSSPRSSKLIVHRGQSIQAAVDRAKPGTTIVVYGTHHETVVIRKDGIALLGRKATLEPPAEVNRLCGPSGFCIAGDADPNTGKNVRSYVKNVRITGFTVKGFKENGIVTLAARDSAFVKNRAIGNGEYGIATYSSIGTRIVSNTTSGSGEGGILLGDYSSHVTAVSNDTYGNEEGIFVRDAAHGRIEGNNVHNNCVGTVFIADEPGLAGDFKMSGNKVRNNTRACPGSEETHTPPLSGTGVAILGAQDVSLSGNTITGNRPSGPTAFLEGGGVIVRGLGRAVPKDNAVVGNTILDNRPEDIFWDRSGSGNRFAGNRCGTSVPGGLCRS